MKRWTILFGMAAVALVWSLSALAGRTDIDNRGTLEAPGGYGNFNVTTNWAGEKLLVRDSSGNLWLTYFKDNGDSAWPTTGNESWASMVTNALSLGTTYSTNAGTWTIDAIADVNGDGQSELVLRSGTVTGVGNNQKSATRVVFFADNGTGQIRNSQPASFKYKTKWTIEGAGNFNTNTYAFNTNAAAQELLLRDSSGNFWLTYFRDNGDVAWPDASWDATPSNVVVNAALSLGTLYSTNASHWTVQAIGDVNGDGKDDVAIRTDQTTGTGSNIKSAARVLFFADNGQIDSTNQPTSFKYKTKWTIEGAGNFNTNTYAFNTHAASHELLCSDTSGNFWLTYFRDNGDVAWPDASWDATPSNVVVNAALSLGTLYSTNASHWTVQAIGDANGDAKDDVVIRTDQTTGAGSNIKSAARVLFFADNGQIDSTNQPTSFKYKTKWLIQGFNSKK